MVNGTFVATQHGGARQHGRRSLGRETLALTRSPHRAGESQESLRQWQNAVAHDRLAHLVKYAARSLSRALQMRLTEHEVSYGHWTFLRILWACEGLTQRELSAQAGVMEPTTFSALKAMEQLGYVTREQSPHNRKNVHVYLTPKGRALKSKLVPLAVDVNEVAVRGLSAADVAVTRRTLLTVIRQLAADEAESLDKRRRIPSTRELARLVRDSKTEAAAGPRRSRAATGPRG
jgi:DNA-binding MarR family transcriptional regulator